MNDTERKKQLNEVLHSIEDLVPFNRYLGLHADSIDENGAAGRVSCCCDQDGTAQRER